MWWDIREDMETIPKTVRMAGVTSTGDLAHQVQSYVDGGGRGEVTRSFLFDPDIPRNPRKRGILAINVPNV